MNFQSKTLAIIVLLSIVSASGTFPYGYRFASHLFNGHSSLQFILAMTFAISSTFLNILLETYSLLKVEFDKLQGRLLIYAAISLAGSVPRGFICYFGFANFVPTALNLGICCIVIIVNTAVGYTSLRLFFQGMKDFLPKQSFSKKINFSLTHFFHILGFFIGIIVSLVGFLAASAGLNDIFVKHHLSELINYRIDLVVGLLAWIPYAALYANGTHKVLADIYTSIKFYKSTLTDITLLNIFLFITCIFSGSALAEITYEFMTSGKNSFELLRGGTAQEIIIFFIVPFSLISSAAVNYVSIIKLYNLRHKMIKNKPALDA